MIYLRTYGSGSKQNENKSLTKAIPLGGLDLSRITCLDAEIAIAKFTYHAPMHLWDFGINASKHLKPKDVVYILCGDRLYYSRIYERIYDPKGEIGDLVGWHRIQQYPWKNPMILKPLILLEGLSSVAGVMTNKVSVEEHFFQLNPSYASP